MSAEQPGLPGNNFRTFLSEMQWLDKLFRFRAYQHQKLIYRENNGDKALNPDENEAFADVMKMSGEDPFDPPFPPENESPYADFLHHYFFNVSERAALMLSLLPHIMPGVFEKYMAGADFEKMACEFAWRKSGSGRLFATGETLLFLLAGGDLELRMKLLGLFEQDHFFSADHILSLGETGKEESRLSGLLTPDKEIVDIFTLGYIRPPEYSNDFPAKRITTEMDWSDLVLSPATGRQINEVKIWVRQRERLMNELGMRKRLKPGYKILFYGAPGTGKTLTAQLLGKYIQKEVFRIDLSTVVSKYIGETEKNLAKVFDKADRSDWILFFDEADALFGSRTKVSSSNDRFANQEVSYLLQRLEDYQGIAILASNMKNNIDDAFMRRFSSVVYFPFPKQDERHQLWKKAFPEKLSLSGEVDLRKISDKYEMSGAHITNIAAWCSLMALEKGDYLVTELMIREGVARELAKEGRTL